MAHPDGHHERLEAAPPRRGSNRNFGFTFAAVGAFVVGLSLWRGGGHPWWWAAFALVFLAAALLRPQVLGPLNIAWYRLGLALSKVVGPIVMLAVYALTVVPTGLILRAMGRDPLRLKWDRSAPSYWIQRDPPGPRPDSMPLQF